MIRDFAVALDKTLRERRNQLVEQLIAQQSESSTAMLRGQIFGLHMALSVLDDTLKTWDPEGDDA